MSATSPYREPAPDVIVVGAGVNGCSIAWRLAEAGRRVLLLERRGICAGASGRNGGITGAGSAMHAASRARAVVFALTTANFALMQQLPDELGGNFGLSITGALDIITTEQQLAHLETATAAERAAGIDVELLDAAATREIAPALTPEIIGATYTRERGGLWPFALVSGMADAAARAGATIRVGARVERLARTGDRITGVVVDGETISAGEVVLATNAWTPELLPEMPAGALVPTRGQILVTQPVPPLIPCPFGTNFDKEYGRQAVSGQVICGGFRRLDVDEGLGTYREEVTPPVLAGIAGCLTDLFPALRERARVVRAWAGIMGFTADGLPLIGRWEALDGLTVAAGFNGNGFSWAAATGQIVADLVTGNTPEFDLAPFDPNRFFTAGTAWANPFTAGEKSTQPVA